MIFWVYMYIHLKVDWSAIHSLLLDFTKLRTGLGLMNSTTVSVLASSLALHVQIPMFGQV